MSSSATDRTRLDRRRLFPTLVSGVFLSGCLTLAVAESTPEQAESTFDPYEVVLGTAQRQTVLTGFLLGGAVADLAVLSIDENDDRRLRIYSFGEGTWVPKLDATLRPEVLFVDVATIGGRDRLVTYEPGRLSWFDPETATERELVAVNSSFNPPRRDRIVVEIDFIGEPIHGPGSEGIPHVDVTRDVNGDGRDDLVVPDVDGFRVFIQRGDGVFADPVKIGPPTDFSRIYGADGSRYAPWSQSRVHEMDYNRDGRRDLVYWNEGHFEVHHQDERGLFALTARTFTTDVVFESDEISSLHTGDMTGRVLHSLTDLNGDGVSDLVVFSMQGESLRRKRSSYEVHFGRTEPDGDTVFATAADAAFQSDGRIQLGMNQHDFDGDGQVDMMLTTIEDKFLKDNLWRRWYGFWGGEIHFYLEFYRMEGGLYPDEPNFTRRIDLEFPGGNKGPGWVPLDIALRGGKHESRTTQESYLTAFKSPILIGDVTGDSRSDLILGWSRRQGQGLRYRVLGFLQVFAGVPGPALFSRQPREMDIAVPDNGEYTWLVDLNKDGKQDILMHHPSTTEPHRVTMLIAR